MHNFTPLSALTGGALIGLSAVLLLSLNGRLAGISSIALHLARLQRGDNTWRLVFLVSLVAGVALVNAVQGAPLPRQGFPAQWLVAAGLMVGLGTAYANGCTSGHGVCGLGRLSLRSLIATLTFLVSGIITTFIVHHVFAVY